MPYRKDVTIEELYAWKADYQAKMDGSENDGRITAYWRDEINNIDKELSRRKAKNISCETFWLEKYAERITIISSGFGGRIAVFEIPDYNVHAAYITEDEYQKIRQEAGKSDL